MKVDIEQPSGNIHAERELASVGSGYNVERDISTLEFSFMPDKDSLITVRMTSSEFSRLVRRWYSNFTDEAQKRDMNRIFAYLLADNQ